MKATGLGKLLNSRKGKQLSNFACKHELIPHLSRFFKIIIESHWALIQSEQRVNFIKIRSHYFCTVLYNHTNIIIMTYLSEQPSVGTLATGTGSQKVDFNQNLLFGADLREVSSSLCQFHYPWRSKIFFINISQQ